MLRGYVNVAAALILIGVLVALATLACDALRRRSNHTLYRKSIVAVAIVGAVMGAVLDRFIGPYLLLVRERLSDINLYTPILFAVLSVLVFKKIIDAIDT